MCDANPQLLLKARNSSTDNEKINHKTFLLIVYPNTKMYLGLTFKKIFEKIKEFLEPPVHYSIG